MTSISVVIPALNDAALLRSCLAALALQSRRAHEIIVVDNGSVDATVEVAQVAGALVLRQPVRGIFAASALGYDAATGDIIARLDADSVPAADWIATIERELGQAPSLSAISGPARFYGGNRFWRWFGATVYVPSYYSLMRLLTGHAAVFGSNFAMHREVWAGVRSSVHLDDPELHDDMDLSLQLLPEMTVLYVPALTVSVSARPFASVGAMAKRIRWGRRTMALGAAERSYRGRRSDYRRLHPR